MKVWLVNASYRWDCAWEVEKAFFTEDDANEYVATMILERGDVAIVNPIEVEQLSAVVCGENLTRP